MSDDRCIESSIDSAGDRRRQFIHQLGLLGAALLLPPAANTGPMPGTSTDSYSPQALRPDEFAAVMRLMSRLIPADGPAAGAVEAGAHCYLDRALNSYDAGDLPMYRAGLAALNRWLKESGAVSLEHCSATELDTLISQLEAGALDKEDHNDPQIAAALPDGGRILFLRLRQHTIQGLFCDPMYGGNQGFAGWHLIGFSGVQFYYSAAEQSINGRTQSANHSIGEFGALP